MTDQTKVVDSAAAAAQSNQRPTRELSAQFAHVPGANPYERGLVAEIPKDKPKNGARDWW